MNLFKNKKTSRYKNGVGKVPTPYKNINLIYYLYFLIFPNI